MQHFGHVALDDLARQPLGDGGLADAGIADIERVVLRPAAEDLDRPVDLGRAADQRVDLAGRGLLVEVDGELVEREFLLSRLRLGLVLGAPPLRARGSSSAPPLPTPWLMKLTASSRLMSCCCRK